MLQAQLLELLLRLVSEHMAARRPESSHRLPDRLVFGRCLVVHEASVCDLALRGALGEVGLLVGHAGEGGQAETFGQCVDSGVTEEGDAAVVWTGDGGVVFHCVAADGGEVVAFVDVFEDGGAGVDVVIGEGDAAW